MSLEGKVRVNTHYTRSINLERDADSASVVRTYLPTRVNHCDYLFAMGCIRDDL